MKVVNVVCENDVNFIFVVGGGSVIDGVKFVVVVVNFVGDLWDIFVKGVVFENLLFIGVVFILFVIGFESNGNLVVNRKEML